MNMPTYQHPVSLGRIDYMNVAPIYYGLDNGLAPQGINLFSGPPNTLNQMMMNGSLDISPVSSAAHARNAQEWLILPDLAIASHERVLSVLLVSRYRLEALTGKRILITDESSSARDLCRLIFRIQGIRPEFVFGKVKRPWQLPEDIDAALVIGDLALSEQWGKVFSHIHDLGTLWWQMTGLPFVFAVWAVRKTFARNHPERVKAVLTLLKTSRGLGHENMNQIIEKASTKLRIDVSIAGLYYESLVYRLAEREIEGLELFYKRLYQTGIMDAAAPMFFFETDVQQSEKHAPFSYADSPAPGFSQETAGCCPAR